MPPNPVMASACRETGRSATIRGYLTTDLAQQRTLLTTALVGALLPKDVPEGHVVRAWLDSWSGIGHVVEEMHEVGYNVRLDRSPFQWSGRVPARSDRAPAAAVRDRRRLQAVEGGSTLRAGDAAPGLEAMTDGDPSMRVLRVAGTVLVFLAGVAWAQSAAAWGDLGHKAVCEIAFQGLNQKAKQEVVRLIRTDPDFKKFSDSCTWPDHPSQRAPEHFINAPRSFSRFTDARCPLASLCLFTAITSDLQVLRTPPNDQASLRSLKFLGHWIGDLHEPLHVSFQDDRGGNSIRADGACVGSLHSVWDTCILERGIGTEPRLIAQVLLAEIRPSERASWTATPRAGWVNESFLIARMTSVQYL